MTILTPSQIYGYAYRAGFRGADLLTAVAVAIKESGGNTQAYNPESAAGTRPGSGSRGLWQIYGTAHPEYNNTLVFDPQANANAAYKVYREAGGRFTPWSTYNNGSASALALLLRKSLSGGQINNASVIGSPAPRSRSSGGSVSGQSVTQVYAPAPVATNDSGSASPSLSNIVANVLSGNVHPVQDFFAIGFGAVLIIIGLVALFMQTDAGKQVIEVTGKAIKTAAIAA